MKRSLGICYCIYSVHRKMIYKGGLGIQIEPIYIHSGQVFIHKVWKLYFFLSASCLICKWHRSTEISQGWQPLLPRGSYTTGRVHQPPCDVFMFLHTIGDIPGSFPNSSYTIHISHKGNSVPLSDTIRGLGGWTTRLFLTFWRGDSLCLHCTCGYNHLLTI